MPKTVYVLETEWTWDYVNTEYATITVESYERGFEEIINMPDVEDMPLIRKIKDIFKAQDRSIMGKGQMIRL